MQNLPKFLLLRKGPTFQWIDKSNFWHWAENWVSICWLTFSENTSSKCRTTSPKSRDWNKIIWTLLWNFIYKDLATKLKMTISSIRQNINFFTIKTKSRPQTRTFSKTVILLSKIALQKLSTFNKNAALNNVFTVVCRYFEEPLLTFLYW